MGRFRKVWNPRLGEGRLVQLYRNSSSSDEFFYIDETYTSVEEGLDEEFYILTATVFRMEHLDAVRNDLMEIAGEYFHSTEALQNEEGRQTFEDLATYFHNHQDVSMIACSTSLEKGYDNEAARQDCIRKLLKKHVPTNGSLKGIIFETRNNPAVGMQFDSKDQWVLRNLRADSLIPPHDVLPSVWTSPAVEPLLWAPDVVGMAYRRTRTHTDDTSDIFFDYLNDITEVEEF